MADETRFAVLINTEPDMAALRDRIEQYLPQGYKAELRVVIRGRDDAGWTLDDYVLPRLASGLYFATEVQAAGLTRTLA